MVSKIRSSSASKMSAASAVWEQQILQQQAQQQQRQSNAAVKQVSFRQQQQQEQQRQLTAAAPRETHRRSLSTSKTIQHNQQSQPQSQPQHKHQHHHELLLSLLQQPDAPNITSASLTPLQGNSRTMSVDRRKASVSADVNLSSGHENNSTNPSSAYIDNRLDQHVGVGLDDPDEVTRAILSIREKRVKQASSHRSQSRSRDTRQKQQQAEEQRQAPTPPTLPKTPSGTSQRHSSQNTDGRQHQQHQQHNNKQYQAAPSSLTNQGRAPSPAPGISTGQENLPRQAEPVSPTPTSSFVKRTSQLQAPSPPVDLPDTNSQKFNNISKNATTRAAVGALLSSTTPHSFEEDRAQETLKKAESRIDGLLQELDELKFFNEIDQAKPSPSTQKVLGAMRSNTPTYTHRSGCSGSGGGNNGALNPLNSYHQQHSLHQRPLPCMPNGDSIPQDIIVPPREKVPLPPPPNNLSPRKISKLDRTSLELETQTLCRQVQVLTQEKLTLERELHVVQLALQDATHSVEKVRQLESHLIRVQQQLKQAKAAMEQVRKELSASYEHTLQTILNQQQEEMALERSNFFQELEKKKTEYHDRKQKWKEELRSTRESSQAKETVLELQLTEATEALDELGKHCDEKDEEIDQLRDELAEMERALSESKEARDDAYETKVSSLEEQLSQVNKKFETTLNEKDELSKKFLKQSETLENISKQYEEQKKIIEDMTERLDAVHTEYKQKFGELKDVYENKEKRRMSELVTLQSTEVDQYERRIQSLQEQLTLSTDRHYSEIRQKEKEFEDKWGARRSNLRVEMEREFDSVVTRLKEELANSRNEYTTANTERVHLRAEIDTIKKDFRKQRDDLEAEARQHHDDISRLKAENTKLKQLTVVKEANIHDLSLELSKIKTKHTAQVTQMESNHANELKNRELLLENNKKEFHLTETNLKCQLSKVEADVEKTSALLESRVDELQNELQLAHSALSEAHKLVSHEDASKVKVEELTQSCKNLKAEMESERQRFESLQAKARVEVALFEGKLRASETTLQQKRTLIEDLEEQLRKAKKNDTLHSLESHKELATLRNAVEVEKLKVNELRLEIAEKCNQVDQLEEEAKECLERTGDLASTNAKLQEALTLAEDEKKKTVAQLSQLQKDFFSANKRLIDYEKKVSENNYLAEEMERKEKQWYEQKSFALKEVQSKLENELSSNAELKAKISLLEFDLSDKEQQLLLLPKLQTQINDLIETSKSMSEQLQKMQAEVDLKDKALQEMTCQQTEQHDEMLKILNESGQTRDKLIEVSRVKEEIENQLQRVEQTLKTREELIDKLSQLGSDLEEKENQLSQMPKLKSQLHNMVRGSEQLRMQLDNVKNELERRSKDYKRALQEHTTQINDMCDTLNEQRKAKELLESQLQSTNQDLKAATEKAKDFERLNAKLLEVEAAKLECDVELSRIKLEMKQKDNELERYASEASCRIKDYNVKIVEHDNARKILEIKLRDVEEELRLKTEREDRLSQNIFELRSVCTETKKENEELKVSLVKAEAQVKLQKEEKTDEYSEAHQTKMVRLAMAKKTIELKLRDLEAERDEREKHMRESAERSSNQIVDLQMQVEELSRTKASLQSKLGRLEAELYQKENIITTTCNQYSGDMNDLHTKLAELLEEKSQLEGKIDILEKKLSLAEQESHRLEDLRHEEFQSKIESEIRENRSLRMRIGDVEAEVDRKEKQLKDVVNRYSQEIADLKDSLADQSRAKGYLQKEVDQIKKDATTVSHGLHEVSQLREKVTALEKAVEVERALSREADKAKKRLEELLSTAESNEEELKDRLTKATKDRTEVINALEEVIHEVQNREEEIESLANILRRRDEELEHAKLIATKALASAQEIKSRYKEKGADRVADFSQKVDELNSSIEYLSKKNESLQRKVAALERQVKDKESECFHLRDLLRNIESKSKSERPTSRVRPLSNENTTTLTNDKQRSSSRSSFKFEESSPRSPSDSLVSGSSSGSSGEHDITEKSNFQTASGDSVSNGSWIQNTTSSGSTDSGDSDNVSFVGVRKDANNDDSNSRRSIERDALRKYVRKRYLKSKSVI